MSEPTRREDRILEEYRIRESKALNLVAAIGLFIVIVGTLPLSYLLRILGFQ